MTSEKRFWVLCFIALMFLPGAAYAQNPYITQVRDQLMGAAVVLVSAGHKLTHEPIIKTIRRGGSHSVTMNLRKGVKYGIVGVCDQDCSDMNLALYDSDGRLIDIDYRYGKIPVVTVVPGYNDRFKVSVTVPRCRASQCTVGVGIFGRARL